MDHSAFAEQLKRIEQAFRPRGNLIIQGDNLDVLQRMRATHEGEVACAYIDPPYNNMENWSHYQDSATSAVWLDSITNCARLIRDLLSEQGSLWVSIDDKEMHYLKVALDGVFGRENFVTTIVWQQRTTRENRKVFSNDHEYILVYARNLESFKKSRNTLPYDDTVLSRFSNPDNDPRGLWQSVSLNAQAGHATKSQFYDFVAPNGKVHQPPNGRCWIFTKERMAVEVAGGNVWFGKDGNGVPRRKKFLSESTGGLTPQTLWLADEVGTNDAAKKHMLSMFPGKTVFDTPKPETLIQRIFEIASNPGDLILDAYLGSGTSAAVAQKMGRRFVGIEIGDHALSYCVERLKKVRAGLGGGIAADSPSANSDDFEFLRIA